MLEKLKERKRDDAKFDQLHFILSLERINRQLKLEFAVSLSKSKVLNLFLRFVFVTLFHLADFVRHVSLTLNKPEQY